jgi:hypothetical protein
LNAAYMDFKGERGIERLAGLVSQMSKGNR